MTSYSEVRLRTASAKSTPMTLEQQRMRVIEPCAEARCRLATQETSDLVEWLHKVVATLMADLRHALHSQGNFEVLSTFGKLAGM